MHENFLALYGIDITNIRIESFQILDEELASNISGQAFLTAQTQNQLSNLAGQSEIAVATQKRDAEVSRIKSLGEATKLKTETDAKNRATLETAKALSEATVIRAKAEAAAIELKAQAEAKAILARGEAETKRAQLLSSTALGGQIQMYQMYAEMVKTSLKGVSKVLYVPDNSMSALNFMGFQQGSIPGMIAPSNALQKK